MKCLLIILTIFASLRCCWAHESAPANVAIQLEAIQMEGALVSELLQSSSETSDATAMRDQIEEWIEASKATVVETAYIVTKSGQRTKVESVLERIYGVEFDPPELPQEVGGPLEAEAIISTPVSATTHEMRPEGIIFEVDPQVGPDGVTIDLSLAPELVQFLGNVSYGQDESVVEMPLFQTRRVATNISLISGDYVLLGVLSSRLQDGSNSGKYTLLFLTASVKSEHAMRVTGKGKKVP